MAHVRQKLALRRGGGFGNHTELLASVILLLQVFQIFFQLTLHLATLAHVIDKAQKHCLPVGLESTDVKVEVNQRPIRSASFHLTTNANDLRPAVGEVITKIVVVVLRSGSGMSALTFSPTTADASR